MVLTVLTIVAPYARAQAGGAYPLYLGTERDDAATGVAVLATGLAILVDRTGQVRGFPASRVQDWIHRRPRERVTHLVFAVEDQSAMLVDRVLEAGGVELVDVICAKRLLGDCGTRLP